MPIYLSFAAPAGGANPAPFAYITKNHAKDADIMKDKQNQWHTRSSLCERNALVANIGIGNGNCRSCCHCALEEMPAQAPKPLQINRLHAIWPP